MGKETDAEAAQREADRQERVDAYTKAMGGAEWIAGRNAQLEADLAETTRIKQNSALWEQGETLKYYQDREALQEKNLSDARDPKSKMNKVVRVRNIVQGVVDKLKQSLKAKHTSELDAPIPDSKIPTRAGSTRGSSMSF